jgi:hypothetical protein
MNTHHHLYTSFYAPTPRDHIREWKDRLWNVHLEDMKAGVHDHLMFGEPRTRPGIG